MNIHYYTFYLFDDVPLVYNYRGTKCIIRPLYYYGDDDFKHAIILQKQINNVIWGFTTYVPSTGIGNVTGYGKGKNDVWVAICYWNTGKWNFNVGNGTKLDVVN